MIIKIKNWKKNILNKDSSINDAIKLLNVNISKIVLIVDDKKKLLGTITNSDIRRVLIKGYTKKDSIIYALNKKPITTKNSSNKKSILNLMIKNKINAIPLLRSNKKVVGIYLLSTNNNIKINDTIICIMAGGKGKRLLPLTKNTPKPMLKISGKPMAERLLIKARNEGFKDFVFSVNYLYKKITSFFKDGKKWGTKIKYVLEKKPLGTAGSLALLQFNKAINTIIVINCDVVTKLKLRDFLVFHKTHKQIATVASIIHETKNQFGIIKTKGSRLVEIVEKPVQKNYVNAGIYAFNKSIIDYIPKNKKIDINELFKKILLKKKKIVVYPLHEPWADVGKHNEL
ncbi:CBS domain-containing protein, partial [Pelagibacterales bacterium SAG-MED04]|nr:CBS domain-containing protein [Pelagibacterales bacterium SAG-MED04]